jgi:hypothetical protein
MGEPSCVEMTGEDHEDPGGSEDQYESSSKRDRARGLARKAKDKTRDLFNSDGKEASDAKATSPNGAIDEVSSDPAFSPAMILNQSPPKLRKGDHSTIKSELNSVANTIAHPRQTIQEKATRKAATKISSAQRPFLSPEQDRNLLAAHDELDKLASSRSSTHARTSAESTAETRGDEGAARQKVEELEEQRSGLHVAWTLGKHVDRVKIVQARFPMPPSWDDFVETSPSRDQGRFQWERWLGYQALYHTRGFTARYIDDFEELPFDIEDLSRTVERLFLVSAPWQAWLMSVRQVYTWKDPKRTGKWFVLYCLLWYTEHIMGFMYGFIIYTVLRNKYLPSSIESVRHSMKHGVDHEANAQAWGELVERHGRKDWIEPLLDEIGPYIQLQLGDLTDLLEVLANFYRWKSPWKTAETLFFFGCCLLVTLFTDMAFCIKIIWFVAGGWFFLCSPIASRHPKYRYLIDPAKWILWDIPTNAEWSIEFLQRKASMKQKETDREEPVSMGCDSTDGESPSSDFYTPSALPRRDALEKQDLPTETFKFRAFQLKRTGHILIGRRGISFSSRRRKWSIAYGSLIEMCKVKPDAKIKTITFGIVSSGLQFFAKDSQGRITNETISVHRDKRDEIFNLVLGWSGLKWRAVRIERPIPKTSDGTKKHLEALI